MNEPRKKLIESMMPIKSISEEAEREKTARGGMTELMILIDAVSSAQFITQNKTNRLIEKLASLAGRQHIDSRLFPALKSLFVYGTI